MFVAKCADCEWEYRSVWELWAQDAADNHVTLYRTIKGKHNDVYIENE